jgi:DNA invertase Pin-like site-specific DNA recombinase
VRKEFVIRLERRGLDVQALVEELVEEGSTGGRHPSTTPPGAVPRTRVLGYATARAGAGEHANAEVRRQMDEIASACECRGLSLLEVVRDRVRERQRSLERPGFQYALRRIAARKADGLVVAELSRFTHSVPDLGRVLEWLEDHRARLVVGVPGLDTNEEAGRLAIQAIVEVSRWERERLVERTRSGMRAARRKGPAAVADDPQLKERIVRMRAAGMTLQSIADQLNAEGVPTVRGGATWRPSSVQAAAGYRRPPASQRFDPQRSAHVGG